VIDVEGANLTDNSPSPELRLGAEPTLRAVFYRLTPSRRKADCRDSSILLVALAWSIAGQQPACKSIIDESCAVRWCTERGSFFVCERRTGLSIKASS
jgi:hypothetical protein